MASFSLTQSQGAALDEFKGFLDGKAQVFMLRGAAGTGKTTLVSEFIAVLRKLGRQFALMAPTGRAAFIIGNKTGCPAYTIHKTIYGLSSLKSSERNGDGEDEDGGLHAKFGLRTNKDAMNTVYIVDESSLVSDAYSENEAFMFGSGHLLRDLFEYVHGRKIVFVGDYAQLPPVGMNFSPALDSDYVKSNYNCDVVNVMLREVVRQGAQSGILSNATKIRDKIEAKTFIEFKMDSADDCHSEDDDLLHPYYNLSKDHPCVNGVIVAYSNKQALQYNQQIRRRYFGENAERLLPGELLMIARNNYAYDVELFNGNIIKVVSCGSDDEIEQRPVRVKVAKDRVESVNLRFRRVTIKFKTRSDIEELNVTLLDNFLDDQSVSVGGLLARALIVDFNNRLTDNVKNRLPEIRRLLRTKETLNEEQQKLCDEYVNMMSRDKYYNALICKYGYAVTCHKAQGGEWDNVFVDMCRFGGTANEDYFRWVYTALTRASKQLWLYRSPEFDYISGLSVEKIQHSAKITVSIYAEAEDFCGARFNRLRELAEQCGLTVADDRSRQYEHRVTFTDSDNHSVTYQLWYNAKGYSGKCSRLSTSSGEFASLCVGLLDRSFAPGNVPFSCESRPFAMKLHAYILSLLGELDIQLLNITQDQYHDTYHLKTEGLAKVEIYYTNKGNYTYMKPISSLGADDVKLIAFCQKFK